MFGFGKKKSSPAPQPAFPPLPDDGNPVHRAITGLKQGDQSQFIPLMNALVASKVTVLVDDPQKIEKFLTMDWKGIANLAVFTLPAFSAKAIGETNMLPVQLEFRQLCSTFENDAFGIILNPDHSTLGTPIPPQIFKVIRETVSEFPVDGGLYYVRNELGTFGVLKVLKFNDAGVHVRRYSNAFEKPPILVREEELYLGGMDRKVDETLGIGHLPVSRAAFSSWKPKYIQASTVTEAELEGYRMWLDAKVGYFN